MSYLSATLDSWPTQWLVFGFCECIVFYKYSFTNARTHYKDIACKGYSSLNDDWLTHTNTEDNFLKFAA